KHNQAVDFSKSGQVPDELTRTWDRDLPPEKVERYPDFMCKGYASSYKSDRLLGNLFSRAMEVREIIRTEEYASMDGKIKLDESVLMPGDEIYEYIAQSAYDEYRTLIGSICEIYGIANEAQLFSSRFTGFKKRFAYKGDDKIAVFNMLKEQIAIIYAKFRSNFFDDFGGIKKNTEFDEKKFNGIREPFRRICSFPSDEIRKKASAYYRIAYNNGKFLSFAWLAYDVLAYNRQKYLLKTGNFKLSLCPIIDYLSNYINDFCKSGMFLNEFDAFCKSLQDSYASRRSSEEVSYYVAKMCHIFNDSYASKRSSEEVSYYVAKMCHIYNGLDKLLFIFRKWIIKHGIAYDPNNNNNNEKSIHPKLMDAIVVLHGLGELKKGNGGWLTVKDQKPIQKVTEGSVCIVEIPRSCVNYKQLFEQLALKCDCKYLVVRKKPDRNPKSFRITLKPVGSFNAIQKFRNLLNVVPCLTEPDLQKRSEMIATELYKRLQFYSEEGRSIEDEFVP
uniref:RNA-dependent RNA polymerase n=1 Tax=Panagrolaimus sp. PS1159 TaxID=55785 RepID=A0AC35GKJ9_9BILA